ncbi:MAG: hypothetical protein ACE366_04330 [Bradymonadia bacterium]
MSILVACKGLQQGADSLEMASIAEVECSGSHFEAIKHWGHHSIDGWQAFAACAGVVWDDYVRNYLKTEDEKELELMLAGLLHICQHADEAAIWYAGFPDDIDVVTCPVEFCTRVKLAVLAGDEEPACRYQRHL